MRTYFRYFLALSAAGAVFGQSVPEAGPARPKRVAYYYQTQYSGGQYVSLAPIWKQLGPKSGKPIVTDAMVAAFHLGYNTDGSPYIHLNDNVPGNPMFDTMWQEVATLQSYGVTVRMMLGGSAPGTYTDLFSQYDIFYPILKRTLQKYKLNGMDIDIEENVTLANAQKLIDQLDADFGSGFVMTMAPVASALWGGANLSGCDYKQLYQSPEGAKIAWFNGQFYSGFATMASTADFERIVNYDFPADKVVAGVLSNPNNGSGYVPVPVVKRTVGELVAKYAAFGGVSAWEYFDTLPGGAANPVEWAAIMASAMK